MVKGKADTMIAVWRPLNPPLHIKIMAEAAKNTPQDILTKLGGLLIVIYMMICSERTAICFYSFHYFFHRKICWA